LSTDRPLKVATPETAFTAAPPVNVPPPALLPIVGATEAVEVVTLLP
jgi:hypothetical protein